MEKKGKTMNQSLPETKQKSLPALLLSPSVLLTGLWLYQIYGQAGTLTDWARRWRRPGGKVAHKEQRKKRRL
jgi:hypothetical protein